MPPQTVHKVLDAHGRHSQRVRAFPAVASVYFAMALSLYPEASYEAVSSALSQGLAWQAGALQPAAVSKVAISLLRSCIGAEPLAEPVERLYGWVLMHDTVRWLLHRGAARLGRPHEDLSFTAHVQVLRQQQPVSGAFPPGAAKEA